MQRAVGAAGAVQLRSGLTVGSVCVGPHAVLGAWPGSEPSVGSERTRSRRTTLALLSSQPQRQAQGPRLATGWAPALAEL